MAQAEFGFDRHIASWTQSSKGGNAVHKGGNIAKTVFFWLTLVMCLVVIGIFAVAIIKVLNAVEAESSSGLSDAITSYINIMKIILIIACILNILKAALLILDSIGTFMFSGWLISSNTDALPDLVNWVNGSGLGRKGKRRFLKVAFAASAKDDKTPSVLQLVGAILKFISVVIISIGIITYIGNTLFDNFAVLVKTVERGGDFDMAKLFTGVLVFVIELVISIILEFVAWILKLVATSSAKGWVTRNTPAPAPVAENGDAQDGASNDVA